jgi:hypothetical protein
MPEGELPERARGELTTEQHGVRKDRERPNPFAAEIAGEKPPYSYEVFDRVRNKLANMMDDYPWKNWVYTELHEDDKADVRMVFQGFQTVAYDHLGSAYKAVLQDEFYQAATGEGFYRDFPVEERWGESERVYRDRFELTYQQAQAVQKILRYLGENYDPGGAEPTPENLAKRTFYYDAYLGKPIPKDHPDQPETLIAKPEYEREIAEYLKAKKSSPEKPVKPL